MFTHGAAGSITNPAGGGTVTINFPPDPFLNYKANSFGPVTVLGSALKLMMDKSGDNRSVTIDLDPGNEPVTPNNALIADLTSPGRLTIDGHHRVLELGDSGTLLTVGEGVTLTLRNITLVGINGSTGPLVEIQARGKLILEGGVTLTDHITTGDAGGIWVNGGELVMYDGVVIKKMELFGYGSGAGVGVSNKGKFVMYGGTIGGENSSDGNKLSPSGIISGPWSNTGGGGVGVSDGSFEMRNGIIQSNGCSGVAVGDKGSFTMHGGAIKGHNGGGGVYNSGTFIMTAGLIKDNIVESPYPPNPVSNFGGGGGVSNFGTFIMDGTDIVIEDNVVGSNYEGGGGVGNWGTFIMNGGTIRRNKGSNGGGGVAVRDGGTFTMNDGTIGGGPGDGNTNIGYNGSNGVYGYGGVKFIMSGGIITGNTANGVYIVGEFHMSGSALITKDNMVGHGSIIIDGNLDNSPAANITVYRVEDNPRLLKADSSELITQNYNKFLYEGVSGHINSTPYYYEDFYGGFWYGVYQEQE
jgi:hypothetical protein